MGRTGRQFRVTLAGTIPATAYLTVKAKDEEEAGEIALDRWRDADWDGGDYSVPEGCSVDVVAVDEEDANA